YKPIVVFDSVDHLSSISMGAVLQLVRSIAISCRIQVIVAMRPESHSPDSRQITLNATLLYRYIILPTPNPLEVFSHRLASLAECNTSITSQTISNVGSLILDPLKDKLVSDTLFEHLAPDDLRKMMHLARNYLRHKDTFRQRSNKEGRHITTGPLSEIWAHRSPTLNHTVSAAAIGGMPVYRDPGSSSSKSEAGLPNLLKCQIEAAPTMHAVCYHLLNIISRAPSIQRKPDIVYIATAYGIPPAVIIPAMSMLLRWSCIGSPD